ncbi:MAG: hypothetical protein V4565_01445 [Bacteroidota bacterium]
MSLTQIKISNQTQAIQHFIERMDIEMIDAFLDNNKTYQDFKKYLFISKLQKAFEQFSDSGDTHLFSIEGKCNSCDKTKTGYSFIGNNSNKYMNVIFDVTDGKINDLYECSDFQNHKSNLILKERVHIDDDFELPF